MIEMMIDHTAQGGVSIRMRLEGSTDALLDELAAGMAHAIVKIADDLPAVDEIHESLARVMSSRMIDLVNQEIDLRSGARDELPEA